MKKYGRWIFSHVGIHYNEGGPLDRPCFVLLWPCWIFFEFTIKTGSGMINPQFCIGFIRSGNRIRFNCGGKVSRYNKQGFLVGAK